MTIFHFDRGTHWYNNYTRWFGLPEVPAEGQGINRVAALPGYELPYGFLYEPWFIGHRSV